jgi:UDPglucose--hexose-1-phosphate uridylyltransferase
MSELRQDRTSGRWVIIAPQRGHRPGALPVAARSLAPLPQTPQFDADCPFCPGHEHRLPGIIAETRMQASPGWAVRVVPNKFPALQMHSKAKSADRHCTAEGYGFHEVIIESPRHDADLVSMTDSEIEAVVAMYRDRSKHLLGQPGIEAVVLFRNHGPRGGASQPHPHAQVLALALLPPKLARLADWGHRYCHEHGRCPTCDEIAGERALKSRVVEETQNFLVLVPFAAEYPCETWIVPKQHQASFLDLDQSQHREFARLLRRTLNRLRCARDDPPYSFVIDSAARMHLQSAYLHWRLRIAPDLATWGGFELGTGMAINPSNPEDDASVLRATGREALQEDRGRTS